MGSLQFPNMGMGLRLVAFGRRSSAIILESPEFPYQKIKKSNQQSDRPALDAFLPGTRAFENSVAGESWRLVNT